MVPFQEYEMRPSATQLKLHSHPSKAQNSIGYLLKAFISHPKLKNPLITSSYSTCKRSKSFCNFDNPRKTFHLNCPIPLKFLDESEEFAMPFYLPPHGVPFPRWLVRV